MLTTHLATRSYPCVIVTVIDGDTIDVEVDHGFNVYTRQRIRLANVDCPEMGTPEGRAAKAAVGRRPRGDEPMTDIVTRLRFWADAHADDGRRLFGMDAVGCLRDAAAEIERLRAENAELQSRLGAIADKVIDMLRKRL
jgi:hypothetical protein